VLGSQFVHTHTLDTDDLVQATAAVVPFAQHNDSAMSQSGCYPSEMSTSLDFTEEEWDAIRSAPVYTHGHEDARVMRSGDLQLPKPETYHQTWEAYILNDVQRLHDQLDAYRQDGGRTDTCFSCLLCDAIVVGNDAMIQCLVDAGVLVSGDVAQQVAETGDRDAVAKLLEIGWQIDQPCGERSPPLLG